MPFPWFNIAKLIDVRLQLTMVICKRLQIFEFIQAIVLIDRILNFLFIKHFV